MMTSTVAGVSEKERLRNLVGLDNNRMNSNFLLPTSSSTTGLQGRLDLPDAAELLSLLQKQDEIITELYAELEACKNDLMMVKEQSSIQFDQNRRIFDDLRAQIIKTNLGKGNEIMGPSNAAIVSLQRYSSNFQTCSNCRELNDFVVKLERDKQKLQSRLIDYESDLAQLRRQDTEQLRKIRESVSLVEQAVLEKNEVIVQLKQAQNRIDILENDLKEALSDHQNSMDQYKKSTRQRYESEIDSLKNQLDILSKSETDLKIQLNTTSQSRDELQSERSSAKQKLLEKKKEMEEKLKNLQLENANLVKTNKDLKETLKETEKTTKLQNAELTEKVHSLEKQFNECRTSLESTKSILNVTKKENFDLRERYAILEKDAWQLKQWKQRLERERDEVVQSKDLELKEAIRIAELKHDRTKTELERLLSNQNGLIFKLKEECKLLADQLERMHRKNAKHVHTNVPNMENDQRYHNVQE